MDITSKETMEENGWIFSVTKHKQEKYVSYCGDTSWFGHSSQWNEGSVSAKFKGNGNAKLIFGNCWSAHNVNVYLNQNQLANASGDENSKEVLFNFTGGDVLKITEDGAIIKLHSLSISC